MKPRRSIAVASFGKFPAGAKLIIRPFPDGHRPGFMLLTEAQAAVERAGNVTDILAECLSAKRLSDWAFDNGAFEVRHDYDLKLSEGEA